MDRYEDCIELLRDAQNNIKIIRDAYEKARTDDSIESVSRPLVKSTFEHLRSVLEYSAQDIWSSYNSKSGKIYFPYGKTEALFRANVKRNLPNLHTRKSLFVLVESLQPHCAGDNWLVELCSHTNFNKHNSLSKQTRNNSEKSITEVGKLVRFSAGTFEFKNCYVDGIALGHGKPVVITGEMSTDEIRQNMQIPIDVKREFDWVEFQLSSSSYDTLQLIEKAHHEISTYIGKLMVELR